MKDRKPIAVDLSSVKIERFWKSVKVGNGGECWEWQGVRRSNGGKLAQHTAHRIAWTLAYGQIPPDKPYVYQTCHNPYCCNPAHLIVGTQQDYREVYQRSTCKSGKHPWILENIVVERPTGQMRCKLCRLERRRALGVLPLKVISQDIQKEIAKRYANGETGTSLAKTYGTSKSNVQRILARHDVPSRGKPRPKPIELDETAVMHSYETGKSMHSIGLELGVGRNVIRNRLLKSGVKLRYWPRPIPIISSNNSITKDSRRYYEINESFFDTITEESAYAIGFIQADGNIWGSRLAIGLKVSDIGILKDLARCMGSTAPIKMRQGKYGPGVRLEVHSARIVNVLRSWGIHERKSHTASTHPKLLLNRNYWRGIIDGDGTILIDKKYASRRLSLVGSRYICEEFLAFCRHHGCGGSVSVAKHKSIFFVGVYGREAEKMAYSLYGGAKISLERKQLTYENGFVQNDIAKLERYRKQLRYFCQDRQLLLEDMTVLEQQVNTAIRNAIIVGLSGLEIARRLGVNNYVVYKPLWKIVGRPKNLQAAIIQKYGQRYLSELKDVEYYKHELDSLRLQRQHVLNRKDVSDRTRKMLVYQAANSGLRAPEVARLLEIRPASAKRLLPVQLLNWRT